MHPHLDCRSEITFICPGVAPRSVIPQKPVYILWLQPACSATSQHFHLPPCYESHEIIVNNWLNTPSLNVIKILAPEFRIWQHPEDYWNGMLLHNLVNIPSVPIDKLYKQMVNSNRPINPTGLGIFHCYFFWCWPARLVCQPLQSGSMQ